MSGGASFWRRRNRFGVDWSRTIRRLGAPGVVASLAAELASKHWAGVDVKACAQERLAELLNVSVRTIQRAVAWLRDRGWLDVQPAVNGQLAEYTLTRPSNRPNQGATGGAPFYKGATKTTRGDSPHPGQVLIGLRLGPERTCALLPEPLQDATTARQPRPDRALQPAGSGTAGYGTR